MTGYKFNGLVKSAVVFTTILVTPVAMASELTGVTFAPPKATKQMIVLVHGFRGNGEFWRPYASILHDYFPHAVVVAPNAPGRIPKMPADKLTWVDDMGGETDTNPAGRKTPDKFLNIPAVTYEAHMAAIKKSGKLLNTYITKQMQKHGVKPSNTAVVGYSQGAAVILYSGFTREKPLAGLATFGGLLFSGPNELNDIKSRPPVLLVQGEKDTVVLPGAAHSAEKRLTAKNVQVEKMMIRRGGHSIDLFGFHGTIDFFEKRFK